MVYHKPNCIGLFSIFDAFYDKSIKITQLNLILVESAEISTFAWQGFEWFSKQH